MELWIDQTKAVIVVVTDQKEESRLIILKDELKECLERNDLSEHII